MALPPLWTLIQGSNDFPLRTALVEEDGTTAWDITGATATLLATSPDGGTRLSFSMNVEVPNPAVVAYPAQAPDFAAAAGKWKVMIRATFGDGRVRHTDERTMKVVQPPGPTAP